MKKNKIISKLLCMTLILGLSPLTTISSVFAEEIVDNTKNAIVDEFGFVYSDDRKNAIIGYNGSSKNIRIPSHVIGIQQKAFMNKNIESVYIPRTLRSISDSAFRYNNLRNITMESSLGVLGDYAFSDQKSTSEIEDKDLVDQYGKKMFSMKDINFSIQVQGSDDRIDVVRLSSNEVSFKDGVFTISSLDELEQDTFEFKFSWAAKSLYNTYFNGEETVTIKNIKPSQFKRDSVKDEINKLLNLDTTEKNYYIQQVDQANSFSELKKILADAQSADRNALNNAKIKAVDQIQNLPGLTNSEKEFYKNKVDLSVSIKEIEQIVKEALDKNKISIFQKMKEEANKEIDKLQNLTDKEKEGFKSAIDNAETTDEVIKVLQNAKDKDAQVLQIAKDKANKEIDRLQNLTDKEKEIFKDLVNSSKVTDEVAQALQAAKNKDAQALQVIKEKVNKEITELLNLTNKEKQEFHDRVTEAKNKDEIEQILEEARERNDEYDLSSLEYLKVKPTIPEEMYQNEDGILRFDFEWKDKSLSNIAKIVLTIDENSAAVFEIIKNVPNNYYLISNDGKKATIMLDQFQDYIEVLLSDKKIEDVSISMYLEYANENLPKEIIKRQVFNTKFVERKVILGDLNDSGTVTVLDQSLLLNYLLKNKIPPSLNKERFLKAADFNQDNKVTMIDYALLVTYIMNL